MMRITTIPPAAPPAIAAMGGELDVTVFGIFVDSGATVWMTTLVSVVRAPFANVVV
jgi:hypothetical protein